MIIYRILIGTVVNKMTFNTVRKIIILIIKFITRTSQALSMNRRRGQWAGQSMLIVNELGYEVWKYELNSMCRRAVAECITRDMQCT